MRSFAVGRLPSARIMEQADGQFNIEEPRMGWRG
jgi:hypothetical protein